MKEEMGGSREEGGGKLEWERRGEGEGEGGE